jgi:hypothetical protein
MGKGGNDSGILRNGMMFEETTASNLQQDVSAESKNPKVQNMPLKITSNSEFHPRQWMLSFGSSIWML